MTFDPTAHRLHWAEEKAAALRGAYDGLEGHDLLRVMIEKDFAGRIAVTSSFGAEAAVLLDLVARVDRSVPVLVLDTGRLFPETYAYIDELSRHLGLTDVRLHRPSDEEVMARDPDGELYRRDPDACCDMRKTRPLNDALRAFDAWITGRKRFHGATRSSLRTIEAQDGRIKINPLATWEQAWIDDSFKERDLPRHPLVDQGFLSIGCTTCTAPVTPGEHVRAGRWRGTDKTECGIHCSVTAAQ
ncbi:MAG: phosphoadenylyl-sulfate reductase [Alphaproteobacteria bacterium]